MASGSIGRWRPTSLEDSLHCSQRLFAHMVLDAFAVDAGGFFGDAELPQELFDDLVTAPGLPGQSLTGRRQLNRLVGFGGHQAVTLQPADRVVDRRMGDVEHVDQILGAADAVSRDRLGNRLHIILGNLVGVIESRSFVRGKRHPEFWSQ